MYPSSRVWSITVPSRPGMYLFGECQRMSWQSVAGKQDRILNLMCCCSHRLLLYPKSTHALSEVEVESDSFMNTVLWLHTHLGS